MGTAVETHQLAHHDVSELKFRPNSHLGSSFIEGLRKKYPKACNRSLTNLSSVGLSLAEDNHDNRALLDHGNARKANLSPFSKGLSSSQPDLLQASALSFHSHTLGIDIDTPMGARTSSTSGLNLLLSNSSKSQPPTFRSSLTTSVVEQRLRESRAKMDELASKITEISRSNNNLLDIDKSPVMLAAAPRLSVDSDDVDDSAPISTLQCKPAIAATEKAEKVSRQAASTRRQSASQTKLKLEELRLELTRKCEKLQRRREDIFTRINSRLQDKQGVAKDPSTRQTPASGQSMHPTTSVVSPANPTTHRKSGTDSDGDSGIDLSVKHNRLPPRNSLAPKLRKSTSHSSQILATSAVAASKLQTATQSRPRHVNESKSLDSVSNQSNSATAVSQPPLSEVVESEHKVSTALDRERPSNGDSSHNEISSKQTVSAKCVRFSHTDDVIKSETPRLLELQYLAEESAASTDVLPETDLTELDSDSELSTSDSDCSSTDLTDIDPRLAQLALGACHSQQPSEPSSTTEPQNFTQAQPSNEPSDIVESHQITRLPTDNPSSVNALPSEPSVPSTKKDSPPKPARTHATDVTAAGGTQAEGCADVQEWIDTSVAQPYSIVDASSFQRPLKAVTKGKAKKDSRKNSDSKPPLPKSLPPKKVLANSSRQSAESPYEDVDISQNSSKDNSRRSRLDRRDFEPPYSYSERRPQPLDGKTDSDLEGSVATEGSTPTQSLSKKAACVNNTIPDQFSTTPARGRASSCNDLWGSNASIYSSNEKLGSNSSLSGSRSSLFERVGSFKQAAKKRMKSLRRSLSLDRLGPSKSGNSDLPPATPLSKKSPKSPEGGSNSTPPIKKSLSWRALNQLKLSKKASYTVDTSAGGDTASNRSRKTNPKKSMISSPIATDHVDEPSHFRRIGKLLELCVDGCRRVQLNRPPHGPFGFYIGPSPHRPGVFVTRLSDSYAEKLFSGLLAVGDEIKEINNTPTSKLSQSDIQDIISKSQKLVLKVKANSAVTAEEWF